MEVKEQFGEGEERIPMDLRMKMVDQVTTF